MRIAFEHVGFSYPDKPIYDDFSLALPDERIIALTGPSGCGKTTLLYLLLGLYAPRSGKVLVEGAPRISVVFQEDRLAPWLTIKQNIELVGRGKDAPDADEILAALNIPDAGCEYPDELSGGMRRRASLARALYHGGELLVMDEPFKGLDSQARFAVMDYCAATAKRMLFVTHDMTETEYLKAHIVSLYTGTPIV